MISSLGGLFPGGCDTKTIPKASGKVRSLGIPTVADRVVQASLKLVLRTDLRGGLQTVFVWFCVRNAGHRTQSLRFTTLGHPHGTTTGCSKVDIKACFDEIDHTALMGRVRHRIGDKRVLRLIKAFLKAGVLTENRQPPSDDHRYTPRRNTLATASQHCPVRSGRALHPEMGRPRTGMDTRQASPCRESRS